MQEMDLAITEYLRHLIILYFYTVTVAEKQPQLLFTATFDISDASCLKSPKSSVEASHFSQLANLPTFSNVPTHFRPLK